MDTNYMIIIMVSIIVSIALNVFGGFWARRSDRTAFARISVRYGILVVMILTLFLTLLFQRGLQLGRISSRYLFQSVSAGDYGMILAVLTAVLCACFPVKPVYVLMMVTGTIGLLKPVRMVVMYYQYLMMDMMPKGTIIEVIIKWLVVSICYAVVLFFSGMGFAGPEKAFGSKEREAGQKIHEGQKESEKIAHRWPQAQTDGSLIVLSRPFEGQQIPLSDGAKLRLGSDAADCHLILELAGEPRCLCSVRWLSGKNCYCITSFEPLGLLYEDGNSVPDGVPLEVQPGTVFLDGQTGQAVFQLGA